MRKPAGDNTVVDLHCMNMMIRLLFLAQLCQEIGLDPSLARSTRFWYSTPEFENAH